MRQAEQRQRQAINNYNSAVRRYNSDVRRAVNEHNRQVQAHNARVRVNRQRLRAELARLNSRTTTTRYASYRVSMVSLHEHLSRVEQAYAAGDWRPDESTLLDLAEGEAANSVAVLNSLDGSADGFDAADASLQQTSVLADLQSLGQDLDRRWMGALFALSPRNPDAARHFCASSREILGAILDAHAPADAVLASDSDVALTTDGQPTRQARIRFSLAKRGTDHGGLAEFVETDIENVVDLFRVVNDGTHGSAGRYDLGELSIMKKRVEDAIRFLCAALRP